MRASKSTMERQSFAAGPLLRDFLRGGALVVIVLWVVLSFAPIYGIFYGHQGAAQLAVTTAFLATGALGASAVYGVLLLMASDPLRGTLYPSRGRVVDKLGAYAAGWVLLYGIAA